MHNVADINRFAHLITIFFLRNNLMEVDLKKSGDNEPGFLTHAGGNPRRTGATGLPESSISVNALDTWRVLPVEFYRERYTTWVYTLTLSDNVRIVHLFV